MHVPTIHADTYPHTMGDLEFGETAILEDGRTILRLEFVEAIQNYEKITRVCNVAVLSTGFCDVMRADTPCRKVELVTDVGGEW